MSSQTPNVLVETDAEQLIQTVANLVQSLICDTVSRQKVCRLALSGGTSPRGLYQVLAQQGVSAEVPWRSVEVFFGDERDVPHDNIESNYRMVQRLLLDHLPIEPGSVYPMPADSEDLAAAAEQYEQTIRKEVPAGPGGIPSFDLILLGVGGDGHTASLFPGNQALTETQKMVVAPFVPVLGRKRMTFTYPLINAAQCVLFFVTGEDKAEVMAAILGDDPAAKAKLPAAAVQPAGKLIYAMDAAAARQSTYAQR